MANSSDVSLAGILNTGGHSNPLYTYVDGWSPRRLKTELFPMTEWLYWNSAHVYAAIKKFGEFCVTSIQYQTANEALKEQYEFLHDKILKTRPLLSMLSLDRWVYGNFFISIYLPFMRFLRCEHCNQTVNIHAVAYKFDLRKMIFNYECPQCHRNTNGKVEDKRIVDIHKINVIRWDPKAMDIDYNPITGQSVYYYTIPADIKEKVRKGATHLINTMPMEFLECIRDEKVFEFAKGQIFHGKVAGPAGIDPQWGFPPLTATIKLFLYTAILRRANEAIALDYVVPFRIIHPAQATPNSDPAVTISLGKWMQETKQNMREWRRDPLHLMFSPVAVEVTHLGGQARTLLTLGEIQEAEKNIIASMGIPQEFLTGGLTGAGMEAVLRMTETSLLHHSQDLNDALQWLTDKCAKYMGYKRVDVRLLPPELVDDSSTKQAYMAMNQGQKQLISDTTIAEMFDFDLQEERKKREQEVLDEARFQHDLQQKMQAMQNTLANEVMANSAPGAGLNYDQQMVISKADELAQQFMTMDPGSRRSQLHSLQSEDYVMYSVVIQRLEQLETDQTAAAKSQGQGGANG